jgi:hypothetical protein
LESLAILQFTPHNPPRETLSKIIMPPIVDEEVITQEEVTEEAAPEAAPEAEAKAEETKEVAKE